MRSGDLKHKVIIQKKTATATGMGDFTEAWADLYPCRAAIWPVRANERLDAGKLEHAVDHKIRIRHPRMMNITADMRIKWRDHITDTDKYFKIVGIVNPDKRNMILDILAQEEV